MTEVIEEGCASWLFCFLISILLYSYSTVDIYVIEMLESGKKDPLKGLLALKYQFTSLYLFAIKIHCFCYFFNIHHTKFSVCYEKH